MSSGVSCSRILFITEFPRQFKASSWKVVVTIQKILRLQPHLEHGHPASDTMSSRCWPYDCAEHARTYLHSVRVQQHSCFHRPAHSPQQVQRWPSANLPPRHSIKSSSLKPLLPFNVLLLHDQLQSGPPANSLLQVHDLCKFLYPSFC